LKYLVAAGNYALKAPKVAKELVKNALKSYSPTINDARIDECYQDLLKLLWRPKKDWFLYNLWIFVFSYKKLLGRIKERVDKIALKNIKSRNIVF